MLQIPSGPSALEFLDFFMAASTAVALNVGALFSGNDLTFLVVLRINGSETCGLTLVKSLFKPLAIFSADVCTFPKISIPKFLAGVERLSRFFRVFQSRELFTL